MDVPRRFDETELGSAQLHCFLAEGSCGGIGLLATLNARESLAEPPVPSSSEAVGQRASTSPSTVSS